MHAEEPPSIASVVGAHATNDASAWFVCVIDCVCHVCHVCLCMWCGRMPLTTPVPGVCVCVCVVCLCMWWGRTPLTTPVPGLCVIDRLCVRLCVSMHVVGAQATNDDSAWFVRVCVIDCVCVMWLCVSVHVQISITLCALLLLSISSKAVAHAAFLKHEISYMQFRWQQSPAA